MRRFFAFTALLALAGCEMRPDLDISLELVGDEMYVCTMLLQNSGSSPLTVRRINVNQEMNVPFEAPLVLAPGEQYQMLYKLYEWPRPRTIYAETDQGIYKGDFSGMGWPKLAVMMEIARRATRPPEVVPAPTPMPAATPSFTKKETAPSAMPAIQSVDGTYVGDWISNSDGSSTKARVELKSVSRADLRYSQPAAELTGWLEIGDGNKIPVFGVSMHGGATVEVSLDAVKRGNLRLRGNRIGEEYEGEWTDSLEGGNRVESGKFFLHRQAN